MVELTSITRALQAWIVEAYELWWTRGADRVHGGFHERLHHDGVSTDEGRRARLHPRQMFAYSHAARLGWRGPAASAVEHGLDFFLAHYQREDLLFRALVSPKGEPLSDEVVLYDQAFALLGLASAYATLGDARLRQLARSLHDRLRAQLEHPSIGFEESLVRGAPLTSNSHMHLLEASLVWMELDADARWSTLSMELIDLARSRLIDPRTGAVREFFGADWQAAAGEPGRIVEPGHQFEWAWLLLRFSARSGEPRAMSAAFRLVEIGETYGVDPVRRAAMASLDADFGVRDAQARLWPQCERLKAACVAFEVSGDLRYQRIALEAAQTLKRYLDTPMRGLWRDRLDISGSFVEEPAPASSFYHIVSAVLELGRLSAQLSEPSRKTQ